ncbi:hypothetical protein CPB86DRAFT_737148 [Serendipita vermifera]|nr:hypothetical protein CPB86DRAFT_737148 [Serendipita vermifera]
MELLGNNTLRWGGCQFANVSAPYRCANFSVPLDWTNALLGNISLAVVKYPATRQPKIGTMFFNFGGPGVSPFDDLTSGGDYSFLQQQVGQDWDIVSWDPRGVGYSEPHLTFFHDSSEEDQFWSQLKGQGNFESVFPLWDDKNAKEFVNFDSVIDELMQDFYNLAFDRNGNNLTYIGTVANARDVAALSDAIDGPNHPINFYGYSYGSLLSMFITQLFPNRVGRIVFDGVTDPSDQTQYQSYLGIDLELSDTEAVWKGFTQACAETGPELCPFTKDGDLPKDIDKRFEDLVLRLSSLYQETGYPALTFVNNVFELLYWPDSWSYLGRYMSCIDVVSSTSKEALPSGHVVAPSNPVSRRRRIKHTARTISNILQKRGIYGTGDLLWGHCPFDNNDLLDYNIFAIFCGDTADPIGQTTRDVLNENVRVVRNVSRKFGGDITEQRNWCHRWKSRAVERYSGPWNKTLSNITLVLGNQADPVTPYRNAKLVASAQYLGSNARLVQRWDFGHTSTSEYSPCVFQVIHNYTHGSLLPDKGSDEADLVCPTFERIMGLPESRHFDPVTSQNGDPATSGPNDPGVSQMGRDPEWVSTASCTSLNSFIAPIVILVAFILYL